MTTSDPHPGELWVAQTWTSIPGRLVEVEDLTTRHVWFRGPDGLVRATRSGFCQDFKFYADSLRD